MTLSANQHTQNIERLLGAAIVVARQYRSPELRAEHLLYVLSGTEEGRRAIEARGGKARKIRRFLENTFEFNASDTIDLARAPTIHQNIQFVIHAPVVAARAAGRDVTLDDLLRQMIALKGSCQITWQALFSGGLVEQNAMLKEEDYRLPEEIEDGAASRADHSSADKTDAVIDGTGGDVDLSPESDDGIPDILKDDQEGYTRPFSRSAFGLDAKEASDSPEAASPGASEVAEQAVDAVACEHRKAVLSALRDLTALATRGEIEEVVGRDDLLADISDVLSRRSKRNVILSGEPGVGKTAIAEGLACLMSGNAAPAALRGRPLLEVSMSDLVSGARYRGDFEARMRVLVEVAEERNAVLFIDEIHMLVGAGSVSGRGGMDASNILKPALARGKISVLGATTPGEMRDIRADGALMRRFQVQPVREPSGAETRHIIDSAVGTYVLHHEVLVGNEMLDAIVSLADRHLRQRRFPDKAFDMIDMSCVLASRRNAEAVEICDVRKALSRLGGPQLGAPDPERAAQIMALEERLNTHVRGQHKAAADLAAAARLALLGLQPGGTAGSYLFNGPSSVGKSEMAVAFARALGLPIVEISMSEFVEAHSVSRLIGAPPGYVGYGSEGLLVSAGDTYPEFVLVLNEVDKAHPDVFDILMELLDKGVVRASDGRIVPVAGAHVIMTANIGAAEGERHALGFGRETNAKAVAEDAIKALFRKEFRARIQKQIQFQLLDEEALVLIAQDELDRVALRLAESGFAVQIRSDVAAAIAKACLEDPHAARSIHARVKDLVSDPLVETALAGDYAGVLWVSTDATGILVGSEDLA